MLVLSQGVYLSRMNKS